MWRWAAKDEAEYRAENAEVNALDLFADPVAVVARWRALRENAVALFGEDHPENCRH